MSLKKVTADLFIRKQLQDGFWWFELSLNDEFLFKAGQYVSVKVNGEGDRRAYSIASAPGGNKICLLVDVSPDGVGSRFFKEIKMGQKVELLGPMGRFVVGDEELLRKSDKLFISTGSGVAPMKSMVEDLLSGKGYKGEVRLVWGMRFEKDVFWMEEFERLEEKYKNFKFDLTLSKPGASWQGDKGRVTDWLEKNEITDNCDIYICGSNEMVDGVKKLLITKGVEEKKIHFEKYG